MESMARFLQETAVMDYSRDLGLFFGIQALFFIATPTAIMFWRLIIGFRDGFMSMFTAPIGRHGDKRSPAAALRFFLFEQTRYGYYMDIIQAFFSTISCIMFIAVAYSTYDPESVQDIEFFFTCYFLGDYITRLYIAQDSLAFFFSGVSLLDFVTVVPAIVTWLMTGLTTFETDVQIIVQCIRVMRVFRIFRVIRVIRVISVSQNYAFQRQVFVLVMTVLSLVFAAAGLFQIFESSPGKEYPFHKAVYYAAITVIGRPGVPFTATVTAVFLTGLALSAATIIPTFVAELIRLWYDNAALDTYTPDPEAPHVIVCGDTNASRLRVMVGQYFHSSRDPNRLAPIVILAEGKPEGALRALLEQFKHSGLVQYVRGSGRRTADLRRAGAQVASACIVLNYRADKDAASADTEVLSTIMAVKSVKPSIRVLAQLHRPRKRHALKLVPGWRDGDRAIASQALGMTLVGVGTRLPGFPALVTHLLRRGALRGESASTLRAKVAEAWRTFLYGESAAPPDYRDTDESGRVKSRTPLDEYAGSIEQQVYEVWVTPGLAGRTFGAAARVAYLRYGVTLLGATVPVNEDLQGVMPGMPRTYRLSLFPCDTVLALGMKVYAISPDAEGLEKMHVETGGRVRNVLEKVADDVQWLPFEIPALPKMPVIALPGAAKGGLAAADESAAAAAAHAAASDNPATASDSGGANIPLPLIPGLARPGDQYVHNAAAATDLGAAWCWKEHDLDGSSTNAFLSLLHTNLNIGGVGGAGGGGGAAATGAGAGADGAAPAAPASQGGGFLGLGRSHAALCETCGKHSVKCLDARLLSGAGILSLDSSRGLAAFEGPAPAALATAEAAGAAPSTPASKTPGGRSAVTGAQFDPFAGQGGADGDAGAAAAEQQQQEEAGSFSSSSSSAAAAAASFPSPSGGAGRNPLVAASASAAASSMMNISALAPNDPLRLALGPIIGRDGRRPSLGDDGFGGIDDTDDVTGLKGPLMTQAPSLKNAGSAAAAAAAATQANTNAMAVRLALPMGAQASEDLTLVLPTAATGGGLGADLPASASSKFRGHVLVCGVSDSIGLLLRSVASIATGAKRSRSNAASAIGGGAASPAAPPASPVSFDFAEGDQYDLAPDDVVILAMSRPADAAMNAMYAGSSRLLNKVTFIQGNPSDTSELLKAGVLTAACAVVLTMAKATVTADGSDNLSDDTESILCTSVLHKLNPRLHITTELLHGGHAPFILPVGANLNDAQRASFAYILEEREAARLRQQLDDAVRYLQSEKGVHLAALGSPRAGTGSPAASRLLAKLLRQQARLRALHGRVPRGLPRAGSSVLDTRSADIMGSGRSSGAGGMHNDLDVDAAFSGLSNSAIVDVLVGVREDYGTQAGAAANEGAGFGSGGGGGGGGGSSKGSGATSDLFSSPSFASGRVFSFATLDSVITEAHFAPYIISVVKQLVRSARRQRLFMLPVGEAVLMARIAATINVHAGAPGTASPTISAANVERAREAYLKEVAAKVVAGAGGAGGGRGSGAADAAAAAVALPESMRFDRYGQLFEALLRSWRLLPVGLYRRVHPATGLKTSPGTASAVAAASGLPEPPGSFSNNRALVSYVYTNPSADAVLSPHDLLYVLACDDESTSDAGIAGLDLEGGGE